MELRNCVYKTKYSKKKYKKYDERPVSRKNKVFREKTVKKTVKMQGFYLKEPLFCKNK